MAGLSPWYLIRCRQCHEYGVTKSVRTMVCPLCHGVTVLVEMAIYTSPEAAGAAIPGKEGPCPYPSVPKP